MHKTRSSTVSDSQYTVFNGTEYVVLIFLNDYAILDRKLDMSYPMEVDTPYRFIDKNSVRIKRLHDDLEVTAAKLMLLVYKLLLLVLEVNAASTKVTTTQRLRLLKDFLLSRDG
ncbi:hypothetical protein Tco_1418196 [Tanacetum coccineum]